MKLVIMCVMQPYLLLVFQVKHNKAAMCDLGVICEWCQCISVLLQGLYNGIDYRLGIYIAGVNLDLTVCH